MTDLYDSASHLGSYNSAPHLGLEITERRLKLLYNSTPHLESSHLTPSGVEMQLQLSYDHEIVILNLEMY